MNILKDIWFLIGAVFIMASAMVCYWRKIDE